MPCRVFAALSSSTCCRSASKSFAKEEDDGCCRGDLEQTELLWLRMYVALGSMSSATSECKWTAGSKDEGKDGTPTADNFEGEVVKGICHYKAENRDINRLLHQLNLHHHHLWSWLTCRSVNPQNASRKLSCHAPRD